MEELVRQIHRHELAARTVRVTFAAAVRRVATVPEPPSALVTGWRSWATAALERYAASVREIAEQMDDAPVPEIQDALRAFDAELINGYRTVRGP